MRKMIYILVLALCGSLSSCRTQKEAGITAVSSNPYLTHYISATSDSIGTQRPATNLSESEKTEP